MRRIPMVILFALALTFAVPAAQCQQDNSAARTRTREQLGRLLEKIGPSLNIAFRQRQKQPFNFVGLLKEGLAHAESFEVVIDVTQNQTIGFRIFPRFKNGYINIDKAKNGPKLMRLLLGLSNRAFLFWGIDGSGDVFTGYTVTLESGFPEESIKVVLRSIVNSDEFIGEMKPLIDGSDPPKSK
jgi:hypothetical protein